MKKMLFLVVLLGALALAGCSFAAAGGAGVLPTLAVPTPILITETAAPLASPMASATPAVTLPAASATVPAPPTQAVPATVTPTAPVVLDTGVQYVQAQMDVNIRSGPGTSYNVVGWVAEGQMARVTGASADRQWWRVVCPSGSGDCWVTAGLAYTQPSAAPGGQTSCTNAATFVADVTVPDGSVYAPGASFVKSWRVRNSGTCTWERDAALAFKSGDQMEAVAGTFGLGSAIAPGGTVDLSVQLFAPAVPGSYTGYWELSDAQGRRFGVGRSNSPLSVKIVVEQPRSQLASVTGFAWRDANGNARRDAGESLAGVPVLLMRGASCDALLGSGYSGSGGDFGFSSLPAGDYCLVGADQTTYVTETRIRLEAGQALTGVNVIWPNSTALSDISGFVYQDLNGSRTYDSGEPGVGGRAIALHRESCQGSLPQATTTSASDGSYRFVNVLPGRYCVALVNPGGIEYQVDLVLSPNQSDNSAHLRAATSGANGTISGAVWNDYCRVVGENGPNGPDGDCVSSGAGSYRANGLWDSSEMGIAGITVRLVSGSCSSGIVLARQATDSIGRYAFTAPSGTYCLVVEATSDGNESRLLPGDWTYPSPGISYHIVTIGPGEERPTVNFGWDWQFN